MHHKLSTTIFLNQIAQLLDVNGFNYDKTSSHPDSNFADIGSKHGPEQREDNQRIRNGL